MKKIPEIYFSHPLPTYHTKTEEEAIRIISRSFKKYKIINPFDHKADHLKEIRRKCDVMVGMSIGNRYPFIVWNDFLVAMERGIDTYTLIMHEDSVIRSTFEKGIKDEFENLSYEETQSLYSTILGDSSKGAISSLFLGKFGKKRSLF